MFLLAGMPLSAQEKEADAAWQQGRHEEARAAYEQVLKQDPNNPRANLRLGILLSWAGNLDSALVLISRARAADPRNADIAVAEARVLSWDKQYGTALALYDSVLANSPSLRDAYLGKAQTLSWAGRLEQAGAIYDELVAKNPSDREAQLGQAQVAAWRGNLEVAEQAYSAILAQNPRDIEAMAGLAHVYHWQGRETEADRQASAVLALDSTHTAARSLRRTVREVTRPALDATAAWSNDSDRNRSFWQTLAASAPIGGGVGVFGSVNALEASDPATSATRLGAEAGLSLSLKRLNLSGAAGARRILPEVASSRTETTYRGQLRYRPAPPLGLSLGYSRAPFDEIAALMERVLNLELLEAGLDVRPFRGFSIHAAGGRLWLSDGNSRTGIQAALSQNLDPQIAVGLFARTLSYESRAVGYFSPDRFSVLEATAGYRVETDTWIGSLGGGIGAQKVGKEGATQSEWHVDGRLGRRWGVSNRIELFGLITNSAVSSTTGAFRYGSAGVVVRLGL